MTRKGWIIAAVVAAVAVGAYYVWANLTGSAPPAGIVNGNGRIEATEIDISTKTAGRIVEILVYEGDFVEEGQILARMDTVRLEARRRQAQAELARAKISVETANSLVKQQKAQFEAANAVIAQRQAELDAAQTRRDRSEQLRRTNTVSQQILDDDRAHYQAAVATVAAAKAQQAAVEAAISSAEAQVIDAKAAVDAAQAEIESIDADLDDSVLRSPRTGRVQFRVAQPGEVLSAGGRVLNLVDLSDVYMTFFLPTEQAGRVALGSEVRLVLDAIPQYVVPAKATFVASVAQFTPRTVETQDERLKLMFRVRARIEPDLLRRYVEQVKTGLPGMAYVKVASDAQWPAWLGNLVQ
ncbi:Inner membrane protein YibH [Ensifer psoraleae]|uniref:HlyD family secretion protein n=1 Tax=Sinorhizobium psoraleae TaxID=520838 RepID=UPI001568BC32|nr:HlyD family secretion protein [Sinorhizobium psoraleae]NRP73336.1 Inner membrane protein YibH [Sinorhizobium psoraleae]